MAFDTQSHSPSRDDGFAAEPAAPAILNSLDVGLLVIDPDLTIRYRNAAAAAMLPEGDNVELIFGQARFWGTFGGWAKEIPRILEGGEPLQVECSLPSSDGASSSFLALRCTPLGESGGHGATGVVILLDDLQGRETSEDRLEVAQRLTSLGKLAARVAHELNNPLDGILRYINLALRAADDASESKLKSYLTESRTGLIRMVQIIGDLLEFSRTTEGEFDEADINEVVEQAVRNTTSAANVGKIVVSADFQRQDLPMVRGSRLYQVCCNLIKNAIDAMPDGGRLSVTTGIVGEEVVIRVADTGMGLPAEADRIFEPFFTTKGPGKGTGLGLAICKEFIEDMHGTITACAGDDGGTVFTIRIPVSRCHRPSRLTVSKRPS